MTVLEELIDAAMNVCEKSRSSSLQQQSPSHSRSAVLLSSTGRTYTGCDVHIAAANGSTDSAAQHGVSAERAAFLAAVADGAAKFDVRSGVIVPYSLNLVINFSNIPIILYSYVASLFLYSPQCLVICSDTMKSFPAPDGLSREFMRSFGNYPVVLVNCNLEIK